MNSQEIVNALKKLDVENDDCWTIDGSPRLDALEGLIAVERHHVLRVAPLFSRSNPELPDLEADRKAAEKAMLDAEALAATAREAEEAAKRARDKVAKQEVNVRDAHTQTRNTLKWIESQNAEQLKRHQRQVALDEQLSYAHGQVGPHPVERNEAARIKNKRKNITLPAKPR